MLDVDTSSPEFQRGDAVGYAVGKTYVDLRDDSPPIRDLGRRLLSNAQDLAEQLGFERDDPGVLVAALLCGMHERSETEE
jgi:hypothetical protein